MIAEDYFSAVDEPFPGSRDSNHRQNRNLNSIVSTIRDDGPSDAADTQQTTGDKPANDGVTDAIAAPELHEPSPAVHRQEIRALPGITVMLKVAAVLVLALLLGASALLASGKYPLIDEQGLHLADMPHGLVMEMAAVKAGIQESVAQWFEQDATAAIDVRVQQPTVSQASAWPHITAVQAEQQQIMTRLDELAGRVVMLEEQAGSEQADSAAAHATLQVLQIQTMQAQLADLQQLLEHDRTAQLPVTAPPVIDHAEQAPANAGTWVVNVASSAQQATILQLQVKLLKQGISTELQQTDINGTLRYRLRVTGFDTGGEAKRYAEKLVREQGLKGAWASAR